MVTQIPGEPLGQLMERLDGTRFSHSGIAVRAPGVTDGPATHLASALAKRLPSTTDVGGVRWDEFASFWPSRDIYCLPMSPQRRARALAYLERFRPVADDEGSFSFVKLVTVAAGLRSVELHDDDRDLGERLYRAAHDVAEAFAATPDAPSFYCAELVANAYGEEFVRSQFAPPKVDGDGIGDAIQEPRWLAFCMSMFADEIAGIDNAKGRAWARLFGLLATEDWDFLKRAVSDIARSGVVLAGDALGDWLDDLFHRGDVPDVASVPLPLGDQRPMADLPDPGSRLPYALVTPRMLWQVFGRDELCRVDPPGRTRPTPT